MLQLKSLGGSCACKSSQQALYAGPKPTSVASYGSSRVLQQQQSGSWQAAAGAAAAARSQHRPRALKDEQAEIDRMTREAAQTDIWGNELVGNAVKVGIVAGVVAVVVLIGSLAKPMYDNTIKSFPTPAEYEQYEQREEDF